MKPSSTTNDKELAQARAVAKKVLGNISDQRIRDLLANGLIFSAGGATTQAVIHTYAPILTELGVDFALEHMNDSSDKGARELAHKFIRDVVGHGVHLGITEAVLASTEDERKESVSRFEALREVLRMASAKNLDFEEALRMVGKEVKGEIVSIENNTLTDSKE